MKRKLFVCFLAMIMLLSLTACGASSKTAASVDSSANDHPAESPAVTEEKGYFDADTNGYDDEGRGACPCDVAEHQFGKYHRDLL